MFSVSEFVSSIKLLPEPFSRSISFSPLQVLGGMAGNAMHIRAIAAALVCVLKAGKWLAASMLAASVLAA